MIFANIASLGWRVGSAGGVVEVKLPFQSLVDVLEIVIRIYMIPNNEFLEGDLAATWPH